LERFDADTFFGFGIFGRGGVAMSNREHVTCIARDDMDALVWNRVQFGLTATYHYLFPQLTMGLALLIVIFQALALRRPDSAYGDIALFWGKIFGINFGVGVVTGIPLEFQFGTNWARFSQYAGGVIGLTLAAEGMFAFFAESAFLGLFLFGRKKLGPKGHFATALMMFVASWLSGYFIVTTNAFMQYPLGHAGVDRLSLVSVHRYLLNPWAIWEYLHTMTAAVVTASFVVAAIASYWLLSRKHEDHARGALRVAVIVGFIACILQLFPTGDRHGALVARHQPAALAAMEGKFETGSRADLAIIGQPNVDQRRLENPVVVPAALSYLAYGSFGAKVQGLDDIPRDQWPDNVELLYFTYHIMVGLGTLFILVMLVSLILLWRKALFRARWMQWILMLSLPFPYIATTAGWFTAELGRQPWLVYGLQRTEHGTSMTASGGDVAFSTLGFCGLYVLLGLLFLFLVARQIARGPIPWKQFGISSSA
jgi:cytochrome d ubiquinol oxidase subunit I